MPIIDKRDRNNWYNSIRENKPAFDLIHFNPDRLTTNEVVLGDATLAKIPPKEKAKISFRNRKSEFGVTRYVELILDNWYDPKKGQSRNRRVIIGTDVSHIHRGMMIINEKYHDYFDVKGNLIYQPKTPTGPKVKPKTRKQAETKADQRETISAEDKSGFPETSENKEKVTGSRNRYTDNRSTNTSFKVPYDGADSVTFQDTYDQATSVASEDPYSQPTDTVPEGPDDNEDEEIDSVNEQDESIQGKDENTEEIQVELDRQQRQKDHLDLLYNLLFHYKEMVDEQARRRPDKLMTVYQIRRINELLSELRDFFQGCEGAEFLKLAEEPDENDPDHYGTTYGDMVILISSYYCIFYSYRLGKLWMKEE